MITEKKCTICKEVKPIKEFYRDAAHRDGYYSKCKKCHARLVKNWQQKNEEKFRDMNKKWKKTHPEQHAQHNKKWIEANVDKAYLIAKRSREKHPETSRNWRKKNPDRLRNYQLTRRARIAGNGGQMTVEEWDAILEFYGHKCLCCGRADLKLTVDHVFPIFLGGTHTADNVQPLCGPCNSRKKDKHIDYRKEYY